MKWHRINSKFSFYLSHILLKPIRDFFRMFSNKSFIENTIYFNELFYEDSYPDVKILGMKSIDHYMKYGFKLDRAGSPSFEGEKGYYEFLKAKYGEFQEAKKLKLPVEQLVKKLKSGFQSLSLLLLIDAVDDMDNRNKKDRAKASWELARAFATMGEWRKADFYLKKTRYFDASFMRKKRPRLLEIETLARIGEYDKALDRITYILNKESDGNFLCALSNLYFNKLGDKSEKERINSINAIFSEHNMALISKKDSSKILDFLNINAESNLVCNSPEKISILLPVYNAENFLDLAVHSLLKQTYKNIEIIAVDDKSTDNSFELLKRIAKTDNRLKVYQNELNSGAYPTRNFALSLATGDIITVHDSDDWSHPQMLEKQYEVLAKGNNKITFSFMVRVSEKLEFSLRPERNNMEYVHRSYPSLMIRRKDLDLLGEWDAITANADDEFVQRARIFFGNETIVDVLSEVPMSFFLKHNASLTSDPKTSLKSLDYGVRKEYALQAKFWRDNFLNHNLKRTSSKAPFPVPNGLDPSKKNKYSNYDLILISDLTLLGGTRRCNQAYIEAAQDLGLKVGIFHWPRFDLKVVDDIASEYRLLSNHENTDILTWEEEIKAACVLIHHPPILKYEPDDLPKIETNKVCILVNQSPKQLFSQSPYYYSKANVEALCNRHYNQKPLWISISPTAKKVLEDCGFKSIVKEVWYPPLSDAFIASGKKRCSDRDRARMPVIGRHARDHWTKWPSDHLNLKTAYLVDSNYKVELLGGARYAIDIIGYQPKNWLVHPFDTVTVSEFLNKIDFFIHFPHEDYIEEFGRNVAEAMAFGIPVILPKFFQGIFGEAAIYCEPSEVCQYIKRYWNDTKLFDEQVKKGEKYVHNNLVTASVNKRLLSLFENNISGV